MKARTPRAWTVSTAPAPSRPSNKPAPAPDKPAKPSAPPPARKPTAKPSASPPAKRGPSNKPAERTPPPAPAERTPPPAKPSAPPPAPAKPAADLPPLPDCLASFLRRLPEWAELPAPVVCSNLGISPYILRNFAKSGEVKTRRLRGRCLVDRASLARCLASRLTGPGGEAARAWIAALDRLRPRPEE